MPAPSHASGAAVGGASHDREVLTLPPVVAQDAEHLPHTVLGAIADFSTAIELDSHNFGVLAARHRLKSRAACASAIWAMDTAIERDSMHFKLDARRGMEKVDCGGLDEAILDDDKAIELRVDGAPGTAYYHRGFARAVLGKHRAAIEDDSSVIAMYPEGHPDAHYNRGRSKMVLGRYREAIADYSQELAIFAGAPVYYARAFAKAALQQYESAIADYDQALQVHYASCHAHHGRGGAHIK